MLGVAVLAPLALICICVFVVPVGLTGQRGRQVGDQMRVRVCVVWLLQQTRMHSGGGL